jgi:predicted membrane-bound dolichyl-phosphate-mannose-protein mannosyltransferase
MNCCYYSRLPDFIVQSDGANFIKKVFTACRPFTGLAMVTKTSGVLLLPAILLLIFIKKCLLEKKFPSFLIDSIIFIAVFSLAAGWW